jgi:hypothetical protein
MFRPPTEIARWREQLRSLEPERAESVIRMLTEAVAVCARCGEPVRRCDPRRSVELAPEQRLVHLRCARPLLEERMKQLRREHAAELRAARKEQAGEATLRLLRREMAERLAVLRMQIGGGEE